MRFTLKEYQVQAVREVLSRLHDASDDYRQKHRKIAFALSAITGAGKTVMAAAVFEALFCGSEEFEVEGDPGAIVLWVTDDPNLNEQTRFRIMEASDRLDGTRLRTVGEGFNQEAFDAGKVYFLNRQKLTAKTYINHSNKRTFTLWETIQNTIENNVCTLYLVLDEAHRGMRPPSQAKRTEDDEERSSTVLRLINGTNGIPPVPIVWGISATVERFTEAMKQAKNRITLPNVVVDNAAVQESGLLKDTIVLDLPDEKGVFDTTLAREAAHATRQASVLWEEYAEREKVPEPVRPLLVVQVPNRPSRRQVGALLGAIYDVWPELADDAVANVFGEHTDEIYGKYRAPYIAPQDVQEATHVRVLLAKDAISTGWDCPRAETLVSLRPATDRVYITQLLGRLIRTPLARRIDSDDRLNAVTCFLPNFDLKAAQDIADVMTGAKQDSGDEPELPRARRVLLDAVDMLWNPSLPKEVKQCFTSLPSKTAPKAPARPIQRLLKMAAEIAVDRLLAAPNRVAHETLYSVLDGQVAQHKKSFEANVTDILTADIRRITANRVTQEASETIRQVEADQRTVDDAFHLASRTLGGALSSGYARKLALDGGDEDNDFDIYSAKAKVAALAMIPGADKAVDDAAEDLIAKWFSFLHVEIRALNEERRSAYDDIRQQAREPQEIDLVYPISFKEATYEVVDGKKRPLSTRDRHLLCDENGQYPVGTFGRWEIEVVDTEMSRRNAVAWYRNPSGASKHAIHVPWHSGEKWKTMQPDFVFFSTKADGEIAASIVDPHGYHLSDALGKLRGLADFAEEYSKRFLRVEAVAEVDRALRMLDLTDTNVRRVVRETGSAEDVYRKVGRNYK